jgi:hypothetical protein
MTSPNAYDPQSREEPATGRLEAFSDGVLAVIITIMALELKAPAVGSFTGLRARLPALLIYTGDSGWLAGRRGAGGTRTRERRPRAARPPRIPGPSAHRWLSPAR